MLGWICFCSLLVLIFGIYLKRVIKEENNYNSLINNITESDIVVTDKWEVYEVKTQSGDTYAFLSTRYKKEMDSDCEYIKLSDNKSLYKNTFETVEKKYVGKGLVRIGGISLGCEIYFHPTGNRPDKIFYSDTAPGYKEAISCGGSFNKETGKFEIVVSGVSKERRKLIWDYDEHLIR